MTKHWQAALAMLPDDLCGLVNTAFENITVEYLPDDEKVLQQLAHFFACSDYASAICQSHLTLLQNLLKPSFLNSELSKQSYQLALSHILDNIDDIDNLKKQLRLFRHLQILRIMWRDYHGLASLSQTVNEISALADTIIQLIIEKLWHWQCEKLGTPKDNEGYPQQLLIIAVGKLGGNELNLSSDIDLIATYPTANYHHKNLSSEVFFTKLTQQFIDVLTDVTAEGFVFRVDMRLRPHGDSGGRLVMSLAAMESYYQQCGRDWERYALVKARIINHDGKHDKHLAILLNRFVYRRYIDYSIIDSLRDLKRLIYREIRSKRLQDNIKRGPGGIREIEFIVQTIQLIRGGSQHDLQQQHCLTILNRLEKSEQLPPAVCQELREAYIFLRHLEHKLQGLADQQTQTLPKNSLTQRRIALAMQEKDWPSLIIKLNAHRQLVKTHFDNMLSLDQEKDRHNSHFEKLQAIWLGQYDEETALTYLQKFNFQQPRDTLQALAHLQNSRRTRNMSGQGRTRLRKLMPQLLASVSEQQQASTCLQRLLPVLENIMSRSVYLSLLLENPSALDYLIKLAAASPWIAELISKHPVLLDELLDSRLIFSPTSESELATELQALLKQNKDNDYEQAMTILREFKHARVLRIASCQIMQHTATSKVGQQLSNIASIILSQALNIVWHSLCEKYGTPTEDGNAIKQADLMIIAYGKLGSHELNYTSDLDLVFIFDNQNKQLASDKLTLVEFYTRLSQRLIHFLDTQTHAGNLYNVDTRLRPSGKAGLLISTFNAFADYQQQQAWTWEHQALVKANVVYATTAMEKQFNTLRQRILCQPRNAPTIMQDVVKMRQQLLENHQTNETQWFNIKHDEGGLVDIEFIIQYLILIHAKEHPTLSQQGDSQTLLKQLEKHKILTTKQSQALQQIHEYYLNQQQHQALQQLKPIILRETCQPQLTQVQQIWQALFS